MELELHYCLLVILSVWFNSVYSRENNFFGDSILSPFFINREREDSNSTAPPWNYSALHDNLQSPIDILTSKATKLRNVKQLEFLAYNDNNIQCQVRNNGHGVAVTMDTTANDFKPQLSGAWLQGRYIFNNIHLHWGKNDYFGSEHFIDGESFSLEGHLVTFKEEYGTLQEALKYKDGITVLTFFASVGEENEEMNHLLQYICDILKDGSSITVNSADSVLWFLPHVIKANKQSPYYAYPGSLTTPDYNESVTFIILPKPITISHKQLEELRKLLNEENEPVETNRRELQPLRGRPLVSALHIKWTVKIL